MLSDIEQRQTENKEEREVVIRSRRDHYRLATRQPLNVSNSLYWRETTPISNDNVRNLHEELHCTTLFLPLSVAHLP